MNPIVSNILLILLFILIGGVFAAAEMALVSLREVQVRVLSTRGKRGRTIAALASNPNRYLSAVQIGVTLSGFLSAAFGGALLSESLAGVLAGWGVPPAVASPLALVLITLVISYASIVIGELSAKRLAMQRAEAFALALAPLVNAIAVVARPVIWFLGVSTNVVVRLLGGDPSASREKVTDEELRAMVGSSAALGDVGRQIVDEVFGARDVSLREVMIPRTEVDFLDGATPVSTALREMLDGTHSRCPVTGRDTDDVLGFVHVRDLAENGQDAPDLPVSKLVRPVMSLPQSLRILPALTSMRQAKAHLAIVRDEYGGTAGVVTIEDLVEELIGDIVDEFDEEVAVRASRPDSSFDLDGLTTLSDVADEIGYELPEGPYDTLAGFVMARLGTLPALGASCEVTLLPADGGDPDHPARFRLTVTELDGRRAARIHVTPLPDAPPSEM